MKVERTEMELGGRTLSIETGKMAKQADGAALVQYGGTVVLGTVVASREPNLQVSFLPLSVEYREKTYAAGRIPGGFFKREGRPTEKETLSARLIDRPLRPLFPDGFRNEVQIIVMVLSADQENDPDILGMIAASSALSLSDIPFPVCIGGVRMGMVNGEHIVCPTHEQIDDGRFDLVIVGMKDKIVMVEGCAKEVKEEDILSALKPGLEEAGRVASFIEEFGKKYGKEKREIELVQVDDELRKSVEDFVEGKIEGVFAIPDKNEREMFMSSLISETSGHLSEDKATDIRTVVEEIESELVRKHIFKEGRRVDGRQPSEVRPISCEAGMLPRTHGSALFTRGETQSLAVATLGTAEDEQMVEELKGESSKTFMLHYNFPPFSVGEVKPVRGPGRREVGHGVLAERALKPVLPSGEEFPYTIRIVSDILESNGSSSMAAVCSGCLALMDAGVPIKAPVAGLSMGLVREGNETLLLTDIAGLEDHFGDMDFKAAGTREGITTIQMDVKIGGIELELVEKILSESSKGRNQILDEMIKVLPRPRDQISVYAPRMIVMRVKQDKIGSVIGPSGRTIKGIIEKTGVEIHIDDDGKVSISSTSEDKAKEAVKMVEALVAEVEIGKIYPGKVRRVTDFGAFVEVMPGKDGLIHISKLADYRVKKVEDVVKVGDEIEVKVLSVDSQGRISLGRKDAQEGSPKRDFRRKT